MSKDYSERRTYRRSPGRQYGYEYDPLHTQGGQPTQSGRPDSSGQGGGTVTKSGALMSQRPDLRRTRQLLRQNIIATKARIAEENGEYEHPQENEEAYQQEAGYEYVEEAPQDYRPNPTRSGRIIPPRATPSRELIDEQEEGEEYAYEDVDPDLGYDVGYEDEIDPLDARLGYAEGVSDLPVRPRAGMATRVPTRNVRPAEPQEDYDDEEYDDEYYYDEEDPERAPIRRRVKKKRKLSRRGLLFGIGAVAVGGAGIAAAELGPKIPQALGNATQNVEQQIQDAFQRGVEQGAQNVRKEFVTALENMEGFSLGAAISAAKLTRVAYDVFVSPVIQFGSTLTNDFLNTMLKAFKSARNVLIAVNMDNTALIAIQKVLESWVNQITNMPKQLNAIADADLDGAQSYLRALQRKIDEEKALLNNPQGTPAATKPTAQPPKKP
ncbi:MAG: hypothetical protein M3Y39_13690 [Chloroflexota bacterium]|nr:hypothetical protein [Chloroflexota bacterium]